MHYIMNSSWNTTEGLQVLLKCKQLWMPRKHTVNQGLDKDQHVMSIPWLMFYCKESAFSW